MRGSSPRMTPECETRTDQFPLTPAKAGVQTHAGVAAILPHGPITVLADMLGKTVMRWSEESFLGGLPHIA